MTTEKQYRYIRFQFSKLTGDAKTNQWLCLGSDSSILGVVRWYGAWREYCYFTTNAVAVFNGGCLADVQDFLRTVNAEHKAERAARKEGA